MAIYRVCIGNFMKTQFFLTVYKAQVFRGIHEINNNIVWFTWNDRRYLNELTVWFNIHIQGVRSCVK